MQTTKINEKGQWLRSDAAESYKRALAVGMPAGGISSMGAGRTEDDQLALYRAYKAGHGNLAAPPGHSLHEPGCALDITRGTPAQLWASQGGKSLKVSGRERIQANAFGWYRTVPTEAWHFSYNPAKDVYGSKTAPAFPLSKGRYFGPALPLTNIRSVSGKFRFGTELRVWQTKAKLNGYDIGITGLYDARTEATARAMQRKAGVTQDGLIGLNTWALPWKLA